MAGKEDIKIQRSELSDRLQCCLQVRRELRERAFDGGPVVPQGVTGEQDAGCRVEERDAARLVAGDVPLSFLALALFAAAMFLVALVTFRRAVIS